MDNINKQLRLSKEALWQTKKLITSFISERKSIMITKDKNRIIDEFTLAFNGMIMLMNEDDRNKAIEMVDSYNLLNTMKKSAKRIQKNSSLAFT